jgi:hypothetical protein
MRARLEMDLGVMQSDPPSGPHTTQFCISWADVTEAVPLVQWSMWPFLFMYGHYIVPTHYTLIYFVLQSILFLLMCSANCWLPASLNIQDGPSYSSLIPSYLLFHLNILWPDCIYSLQIQHCPPKCLIRLAKRQDWKQTKTNKQTNKPKNRP